MADLKSCFEQFQTKCHGRGIRSTGLLKAGTRIMSCTPYLSVSKGDTKVCDECFCENEKTQRCSCCKVVYYCDKKCQKEAWMTHKLECKYLKLMPNKLGHSFRLLLLLLLNRNKSLFLDHLTGHKEVVHDGDKREMIALFLKLLQKYNIPTSSEEIYDIFSKMNCNAFTVCNGSLVPIGTALYDCAFLINHSCQPNSVAVFTNKTLHIHAIKDIGCGEEICISYIELLQPLHCRKLELRKHYFFECSCEKCENEIKHGSQMNALKCPNKQCQNVFGLFPNVIDEHCSSCGAVINKSVYERLNHEVDAVLLKQDSIEDHELLLLEKVLTESQSFFSCDNYKMIRVGDKLSDIYINLGEWEKALEYCERSLVCYKKYYSQNHPCLALQLYRTGKIEVLIGKLNFGYRSLCEAKRILDVCYGKTHRVSQDVASLLLKTTNELQYHLLTG